MKGEFTLEGKESKWKQQNWEQHDLNFPTKERLMENKYWGQNIEINPKDQDCENERQGPNLEN